LEKPLKEERKTNCCKRERNPLTREVEGGWTVERWKALRQTRPNKKPGKKGAATRTGRDHEKEGTVKMKKTSHLKSPIS